MMVFKVLIVFWVYCKNRNVLSINAFGFGFGLTVDSSCVAASAKQGTNGHKGL